VSLFIIPFNVVSSCVCNLNLIILFFNSQTVASVDQTVGLYLHVIRQGRRQPLRREVRCTEYSCHSLVSKHTIRKGNLGDLRYAIYSARARLRPIAVLVVPVDKHRPSDSPRLAHPVDAVVGPGVHRE
jgi:hypothetical protein